jgi:rod shape determining protein RodA
MYLASHLRKFDWILFGAATGLTVFGLSALYSTSLAGATPDLGLFWRQLAFAGLGLVAALVVSLFNYRLLAGSSKALYVLALVMLASVLLLGDTVRGTRGWFNIFGFGIQPVEMVKILLVVYLARFMGDYARDPLGWPRIIRSGLALSGIIVLVLLQPDFGSAVLLMAVWGALLLIAGIQRRHLLIIGTVGLMALAITWLFLLQDFQKARIFAFADPNYEPLGRGYNVTQSVIAVGSGEIFGKGLGFGSQSQLRFLPERQTDFIFSTIAEELGFVGVFVLLGLFGTVFWRAYRLAAAAPSDFAVFLVLGLTVSIAVEMLVNVGAAMRLLPLTGVTLPFVSYGGSSLIAKFTMIGLLESVAVRRG